MKNRGKEILPSLGDPRKIFYAWMTALFEKDEYFTSLIMSIKMPEFDAAIDAAKWVLEKTIAVYQGSCAENDFFLLHGVTSAWSLLQIAGYLNKKDAMEAIFYHLNAVMCVYLIQGSPALDLKRLEDNDQTKGLTWDELTKMVLSKQPELVDEHVYKLAQVCREYSEKTPGAEAMCKRAVLTALNKPFCKAEWAEGLTFE